MIANFGDALRRLTMLAAAAVSLAAVGATVTNADLVPLPGNVHQLARPQFDAGEAPATLRPKGLDIVFAKTPEQERALQQLLAAQQDPKSPQYHQWLTPAQYGVRFGASDETLAAVTNWLKSNGLSVGQVPAGRGHLPFFGSKAQVEAALHTPIHLFAVAGEQHYANVSAPLVPASLTSAITGIRGLNDFHPRPGAHPRKAVPRGSIPMVGRSSARFFAAPDTSYSGSNQYPGYVGPTDFAIMYNLQPAYQQGITGAGVTIAIAAQSDIDASVLTTFWSAFGVSGPSFGLPAQQFTSMQVPASAGGSDVSQTKDANEDEAYLDTEILGALAPGAQLILVRDADAANAAQYVIDQSLAAILNISFGACESAQASANAAINAMYEQAVAEGITITVSSDDSGVAGCTAASDLGAANDVNSNGFAVNGLASTPYDLAVGGTDFNDLGPTQYWNTTNQPKLASALSHIPEMVWNDSCANPIYAQYFGYPGDALTFCNTTSLSGQSNPFIEISGGGSGISSCTTTSGSNCTGGYAQPNWQQGVPGITSFAGRAVPDVSMIATRWLMCSYDTTPCDPTQPPTFQAGTPIEVLEGTSAAAPSVAAIVALIDQTQISSTLTDGRQGLLNPTLYSLAANEYGSPATASACDASQAAISNAACIFYDVTAGSSAQPCKVSNYDTMAAGSFPVSTCGTQSGDATGIMEINGVQSYVAGTGFDIASGLGSINASALIAAFASFPSPSGLSASLSGQTATLTWTADASAASYNVYQGIAPAPVGSSPVQANVSGTSTTVSGLQLGQEYVFAITAVSSSGVVSPRSSAVNVTTVPAAPAGVTVAAPSATAGALNLAWNASMGASSYNLFEGTTAGGEGATPALSGLSSASASLTNLTPGKQYFFTVVAVDAGGNSMASTEASGTTIANPPTGFMASAGNGSVSLSWSAATGASSYNVYEGTTSSGEGAQPVQTGVSGTSATIGGLSNGKKYYFTVAAVDAGGVSQSSAEASATPAAPKGGGGAMDWLALAGLTALLGVRRARTRPWRTIQRS
ncbi:MAG: protease pro-enzyme activation domain-containing protein [Steroidobacteraceae bacterium]